MRTLVWGLPLVGFVAIFGLAALVGSLPPTASAAPSSCIATLGPIESGSGESGQAAAARLDAEQRGIVAAIISSGRERGLPARAWQIAIQAGATESRLRNLDHGHASSVGIFQIIQAHGSRQERMSIPWQLAWFWRTLEAIPGWETLRPGDAAQKVERSAFPQRYHAHEAVAAYLVSEVGGLGALSDPSGCTATDGTPVATTEALGRVLAFAMAQRGKNYIWGATGPNTYDCSGLTLRAYEQAGITLPRVSQQQYTAGKHLPIEQAQPGDLVFWADSAGNPAAIHHVAIYLGNNEVVHAPQSGDVVKVSTIWQKELVRTVTRPGA